VFRRRRFFHGQNVRGTDLTDIGWFKPGGDPMTEDDWTAAFAKSLGVFLNGQGIPSRGRRGERIVDDSFFIVFNAHWEQLEFRLPSLVGDGAWQRILDTAQPEPPGERGEVRPGEPFVVADRSVQVLRRVH
jgi:glycogen operon protein